VCSVRQKAGQVLALLMDDERLQEEREKAKTTKGRYTGFENPNMNMGLSNQ